MKVLFDTSVLVAALIDSHSNHARAFPWLLKAKRGEIEACIGTHTLAELYAILTSLPVQKKVPSTEVWRLIQDSVLSNFEIVQLTKDDYQFVFESLSQNNIRGGTTYDALIAHAAYKATAEKLPESFQKSLSFPFKHNRRAFIRPQVHHLIQIRVLR